MARVLTLDIETAPIEAWVWGLFDQNVGLEQIQTEWSILSYSAKWLGDDDVIFEHTGGRGPEKVRDDLPLMHKLWSLLDSTDIVIAQNGVRFDILKINSRFIMHGLGPYSPIRVIDTMLAAKRHFGFTSNKLGWMSKYLTPSQKSEHKRFPGFELWTECLKDNAEAWVEMEHYNKADVVATEQLYLKLRPWISAHPNMSTFDRTEVRLCPKCGSEDIAPHGQSTKNLSIYMRFLCKSCGGYSRSRRNMLNRDKRDVILAPE